MKTNILLGLILVMARAGWSAEPAVTNAVVVTLPLVLQYTVLHGAAFIGFGCAAAGISVERGT